MKDTWVVDVTLVHDGEADRGLLCFIPYDEVTGDLIVGLNFLTTLESFDKGILRGIVHLDGQEAVESWCEKYPELTKAIKVRCERDSKSIKENKGVE